MYRIYNFFNRGVCGFAQKYLSAVHLQVIKNDGQKCLIQVMMNKLTAELQSWRISYRNKCSITERLQSKLVSRKGCVMREVEVDTSIHECGQMLRAKNMGTDVLEARRR